MLVLEGVSLTYTAGFSQQGCQSCMGIRRSIGVGTAQGATPACRGLLCGRPGIKTKGGRTQHQLLHWEVT